MCFLSSLVFLGHSSWNQNPVFKARYFLCETPVHTAPRGLSWELLWKQAKVKGHCQQVQRLLKPAIPTQGIVNIGSWPLHPTAQNFVLQAHMLQVLLFHGLRSWRAASAVSPEPLRNQRNPTLQNGKVHACKAVLSVQLCCYWQSDFLKSKECVQHSADSTRAVTCRLLVTSSKACIFLSSGSIQDPQT